MPQPLKAGVSTPKTQGKFYKYILEEGKYINHCSINKNTDIQTINYSVFPVIATQDIKKHDEIYMDYFISITNGAFSTAY